MRGEGGMRDGREGGREVGEREVERERKDSDQGFIQDFEVGGNRMVAG